MAPITASSGQRQAPEKDLNEKSTNVKPDEDAVTWTKRARTNGAQRALLQFTSPAPVSRLVPLEQLFPKEDGKDDTSTCFDKLKSMASNHYFCGSTMTVDFVYTRPDGTNIAITNKQELETVFASSPQEEVMITAIPGNRNSRVDESAPSQGDEPPPINKTTKKETLLLPEKLILVLKNPDGPVDHEYDPIVIFTIDGVPSHQRLMNLVANITKYHPCCVSLRVRVGPSRSVPVERSDAHILTLFEGFAHTDLVIDVVRIKPAMVDLVLNKKDKVSFGIGLITEDGELSVELLKKLVKNMYEKEINHLQVQTGKTTYTAINTDKEFVQRVHEVCGSTNSLTLEAFSPNSLCLKAASLSQGCTRVLDGQICRIIFAYHPQVASWDVSDLIPGLYKARARCNNISQGKDTFSCGLRARIMSPDDWNNADSRTRTTSENDLKPLVSQPQTYEFSSIAMPLSGEFKKQFLYITIHYTHIRYETSIHSLALDYVGPLHVI
ncbi:hypothetical protein ACA910_017427 [Epithemia clementina (nom. ined.)]